MNNELNTYNSINTIEEEILALGLRRVRPKHIAKIDISSPVEVFVEEVEIKKENIEAIAEDKIIQSERQWGNVWCITHE